MLPQNLNLCDMFGVTDEYIEKLISRELIDPDDPEKLILDQLIDAEMRILDELSDAEMLRLINAEERG
jgi:hypothetical protein